MPDVVFGPTKVGDRKDALLLQLKHGDGTPADLTGLTTADVRIHIKNLVTGVVQQSNVSAIVTPASGIVRYDPTAADVAEIRDYEIEVKVTFSVGITKRFPNCDRFLWPVVANLA